MIINQNIIAILRTFSNLKKKVMKLCTKLTSTAATTEFVCKIPNRKKISYEHFNLYKLEIFLDEIIKSINSETHNKPRWSYGLAAEFYRHFSNELAVLLGVCDSWGKLDTMAATSRRGIISAIRAILGRITSEKQVGTQNDKCLNRDMQN